MNDDLEEKLRLSSAAFAVAQKHAEDTSEILFAVASRALKAGTSPKVFVDVAEVYVTIADSLEKASSASASIADAIKGRR